MKLSWNPLGCSLIICNKPKCPHIEYHKKFFGLFEVPYCRFYGCELELNEKYDHYCTSWREDISHSERYQFKMERDKNQAEYEKWSSNK